VATGKTAELQLDLTRGFPLLLVITASPQKGWAFRYPHEIPVPEVGETFSIQPESPGDFVWLKVNRRRLHYAVDISKGSREDTSIVVVNLFVEEVADPRDAIEIELNALAIAFGGVDQQPAKSNRT
jgi:hypothetical protein